MKKLFHILFDTVWGPVALWALATTIFMPTVTIDLCCSDSHPLVILFAFVLFVLPATVIAIAAFVRSIVLRHWGRAILQLGWGVTAFGYACLAMIFTLGWAMDIEHPSHLWDLLLSFAPAIVIAIFAFVRISSAPRRRHRHRFRLHPSSPSSPAAPASPSSPSSPSRILDSQPPAP